MALQRHPIRHPLRVPGDLDLQAKRFESGTALWARVSFQPEREKQSVRMTFTLSNGSKGRVDCRQYDSIDLTSTIKPAIIWSLHSATTWSSRWKFHARTIWYRNSLMLSDHLVNTTSDRKILHVLVNTSWFYDPFLTARALYEENKIVYLIQKINPEKRNYYAYAKSSVIQQIHPHYHHAYGDRFGVQLPSQKACPAFQCATSQSLYPQTVPEHLEVAGQKYAHWKEPAQREYCQQKPADSTEMTQSQKTGRVKRRAWVAQHHGQVYAWSGQLLRVEQHFKTTLDWYSGIQPLDWLPPAMSVAWAQS